jgi:beta-glucosidase-like glycosyl hydrolase
MTIRKKCLQCPVEKEKIGAMTIRSLRQDVAQMVMPRIEGDKLDDPRQLLPLQGLIKDGIGGFILFGGSVARTPGRLQELQSFAEIPLLITSDVERGLGQQLAGGTRFPSQRAVASAINRGSKRDVGLLGRMLDAVRVETRAAGIHAVFSPVVDVNSNPDNPIICTRAFGDEPDVVEWFGSQYINRLQKSRNARGRLDLLACAKHFPGHGDTDQDSHSVLPVIRADRARLNRVELPPFREAVKDGVEMVMVAHLFVPALDPEKPVTFSKKAVTALLREGMEFGGLIVSDALDMGALAGAYTQEEIAVRAVEAGMDILLHPIDARVTIDAVAAAVEQGRLTRQRIRESVGRIMAAKKRLGLMSKARQTAVRIDYEQHGRIAREIAGKAVRLVHGSKKLLPLSRHAGVACIILDDDNNTESGNAFIHEMRSRFRNVSVQVLTPATEMPESLVLDSIRAAEVVVLAFYSKIAASKGRSGISGKLHELAMKFLSATQKAQGISVLISFDSPYLLDQFQDADLRIAAYDRMGEIQQAAVEMLAGD